MNEKQVRYQSIRRH